MFADKTAIVTGGARGIGYECALKFAAGGATVVLVDVLEDAMKQAAERLAAEPPNRGRFAAEVSDPVVSWLSSRHETQPLGAGRRIRRHRHAQVPSSRPPPNGLGAKSGPEDRRLALGALIGAYISTLGRAEGLGPGEPRGGRAARRLSTRWPSGGPAERPGARGTDPSGRCRAASRPTPRRARRRPPARGRRPFRPHPSCRSSADPDARSERAGGPNPADSELGQGSR